MDTALVRSVQDRILKEMLGSVMDGTGGGWKALVLDAVTTRILSSAVKMSDILDCNVSVVEDLDKEREPLPLVGVYFIQPTSGNIARLLQDFAGSKPLYPSVHIFFSSPVRPQLLDKIRDCPPLLKVLKGLKETNLEYLLIDSRTVVTQVRELRDDELGPLVRLMGPGADACDADIKIIATRLTTLFSTLKDFPTIRYMLPRPPAPGDPAGAKGRSTLTQRMATALLEKLSKLQAAGTLPRKETCDMLILDRSYDAVAPFIHEWTYEALIYDLLQMDGNIYSYSIETGGPLIKGKPAIEEHQATIDERDPMWLELRHLFVADVYAAIATRFKEFLGKNKAAKAATAAGKSKAAEMSAGAMRSLINAVPEYRELLSRMSLHTEVSSQLKTVTKQRFLTDVGELEQDLVFGEKTSKEMTAYLQEHGAELSPEDKLRLLISYVATHPERLDSTKLKEWQQLAGLSSRDMETLQNLSYLGVQVMKGAAPEGRTGSFFGKKGKKDDKDALRTPREEEEGYALFRFDPLLRTLLLDLAANKLPLEQFPYIKTPSPESAADASGGSVVASARTRPGSLNWSKRGQGGEGGAAGPAGRRLVVLILGGAVRSEMRLVHQLSQQLNRDVMLVSTSIDKPTDFLYWLQHISSVPVEQEVA